MFIFVQHQAITQTNDDLLSIGTLGTNFIVIHTFFFNKI